MTRQQRTFLILVTGYWSLATALGGCESLERKLTRKPKHPEPPPNPIINFQDYSQAMTPLERYRKHYLIFDYWNGELREALADHSPNSKRMTRACTESLAELEALKGLVPEDAAQQLTPLIVAREHWKSQLENGTLNSSEAMLIQREVESQARQIHREFFWRNMEEKLKAK